MTLSDGPNTILNAALARWPVVAAAVASVVLGWSALSSMGFIDSLVHKSVFDQLVQQNTRDHGDMKDAVSGIRTDIKEILREQHNQGLAIERLGAHK